MTDRFHHGGISRRAFFGGLVAASTAISGCSVKGDEASPTPTRTPTDCGEGACVWHTESDYVEEMRLDPDAAFRTLEVTLTELEGITPEFLTLRQDGSRVEAVAVKHSSTHAFELEGHGPGRYTLVLTHGGELRFGRVVGGATLATVPLWVKP